MAEKPTAVGVDSVDLSVEVHPKMKRLISESRGPQHISGASQQNSVEAKQLLKMVTCFKM